MSQACTEGFRVGDVSLANPVFLAPMAGITDLPFRRIAARFGVGAVVSEMVASGELVTGRAEAQMRMEGEGIFPHMVQLAGREAPWLSEAARIVEGAGADIIDINMGCPSKRVTTGYAGAALMRDLDQALELIEAVIGAVSVPVTVKMRLGWDEGCLNAADLARRAQDAGVKMISVHGRTRNQFYKGKADWDAIGAVRESVSIPVIANGDCTGFDEADAMLAASGAAGIMIGRGAYGRPWFPGHVAHYLATGERKAEPTGAELLDLIHEHYDAVVTHYGLPFGVRNARKHLGWYMDGWPLDDTGAKALRRTILTETDPERVHDYLDRWFESERKVA